MPLPSISPSGVSTAWLYPTQTSAGAGVGPILSASPGDTNPPVIFEPGPALSGNQLQVWMIATGASPDWGGCEVFVSVDPGGGGNYGFIGVIGRGAVQGLLTATLASGSDPDTTHTLSVNLTESLGQITAATMADADAFLTLAYVGGASPANFELVSYTAATLTGPNRYNLATYLRRGVFASTIGSHASGAQFALAYAAFIHDYPASLIGKTIYLKFPSFNTLGGQLQDIAAVPYYTYTLTGAGVSPSGPTGTCPTIIVLAGGAAEIDWGSLDSTCILDCGDWGHLSDPVDPICIDMGTLG